MSDKVLTRVIITFFVGAMICLMFLGYGIDVVNSPQLIAVALPLLAIYHYKRRVWLTCLYCVYASCVLTVCGLIGMGIKAMLGDSLLATYDASNLVIIASLVLWSVMVLMTWTGWLLATKNKVFKYAWEPFMFANSVATMTGILICMFAERPANWFDDGGRYILSIGVLYALTSWAADRVTCK